jgi:hypothetical protein
METHHFYCWSRIKIIKFLNFAPHTNKGKGVGAGAAFYDAALQQGLK